MKVPDDLAAQIITIDGSNKITAVKIYFCAANIYNNSFSTICINFNLLNSVS